MEQRIKQEVSERKRLHNLVEDMKGKVRVFCRVRPLSKSEQERNCKSSVAVIDEFNVSIETKNGPKMFGYDTCYGAHSTQVITRPLSRMNKICLVFYHRIRYLRTLPVLSSPQLMGTMYVSLHTDKRDQEKRILYMEVMMTQV